MLICIPNVLTKHDVAEFRHIMDACEWEDGRSTAGAQSALVKRNEQCRRMARSRASSAIASFRR